jgi:putative Mg2+ transporter-C (MgtC) family protein
MDWPHLLDEFLRLFAAVAIGMALGLDRNLNGKPVGMRTLGLVALSAALVTLSALELYDLRTQADPHSRVLGGVVQGALVGIGFLGAGLILRNEARGDVTNLTTAASVWATAAMGLVCAVAPWPLIGVGAAILAVLMVGCRWLEERMGLKDKENN